MSLITLAWSGQLGTPMARVSGLCEEVHHSPQDPVICNWYFSVCEAFAYGAFPGCCCQSSPCAMSACSPGCKASQRSRRRLESMLLRPCNGISLRIQTCGWTFRLQGRSCRGNHPSSGHCRTAFCHHLTSPPVPTSLEGFCRYALAALIDSFALSGRSRICSNRSESSVIPPE